MLQHIILTGVTGMVGKGMMFTCLAQPDVEVVVSISQQPNGRTHPKLRELLVLNFFDLVAVGSQLRATRLVFSARAYRRWA